MEERIKIIMRMETKDKKRRNLGEPNLEEM
jgi:hypothetical protein